MPAYNNYYPATYQPMGYAYQQPQYQPQFVQPPQPVQAAMQNTLSSPSSIIWVTREEALSYPIAPSNAVALWDKNEPVIYLKQADGTGKPTIKVYDLVERVQKPVESVSPSGDKSVGYATKNDLEAVLVALKGYDSNIADIKAEIDKLNSDMYGVAGKRKAAQKAKSEEGDE